MRGTQLTLLEPARRGGRRPGAGRKRRDGARPGVAHRCRPEHDFRHPVHVTLRIAMGLPSFRSELLYRAVESAIRTTRRADFRIVEFSVQEDHLHALVEGDGKKAIECGLKSLIARITKRVKRALGIKRVKMWPDRYHRRDLTSPRQVRNALVYILANFKKTPSYHAWRAAYRPEVVIALVHGLDSLASTSHRTFPRRTSTHMARAHRMEEAWLDPSGRSSPSPPLTRHPIRAS